MENFQEYEGTFDRGASSNYLNILVRKVAKAIVELLDDHEFLEDERLRAHQIR